MHRQLTFSLKQLLPKNVNQVTSNNSLAFNLWIRSQKTQLLQFLILTRCLKTKHLISLLRKKNLLTLMYLHNNKMQRILMQNRSKYRLQVCWILVNQQTKISSLDMKTSSKRLKYTSLKIHNKITCLLKLKRKKKNHRLYSFSRINRNLRRISLAHKILHQCQHLFYKKQTKRRLSSNQLKKLLLQNLNKGHVDHQQKLLQLNYRLRTPAPAPIYFNSLLSLCTVSTHLTLLAHPLSCLKHP